MALLAVDPHSVSIPLAMLIVFGAAKLFAEVLERLGQPGIVGEILAGAVVGPSMLGWIQPNEVLTALEQKELVRRNVHPNNRRVFPAALTAKGRRVVAACDAEVEALERDMLAALTSREVAILRKGLMTAVRALGAGFPLRD